MFRITFYYLDNRRLKWPRQHISGKSVSVDVSPSTVALPFKI